MAKYGDSLRGYGYKVHKRDGFICQYCGFDGRSFSGWLQLTVDHIIPRGQGGTDEDDNMVTVCHVCNSITSRMKFSIGMSIEDIKQEKIKKVKERQAEYRRFWIEKVNQINE